MYENNGYPPFDWGWFFLGLWLFFYFRVTGYVLGSMGPSAVEELNGFRIVMAGPWIWLFIFLGGKIDDWKEERRKKRDAAKYAHIFS